MLGTTTLILLGFLSADPTSLEQARALAQAGKTGEALEAYDAVEKALKADDVKGQAQLALGRAECLAATGKSAEAIAALEKAAAGAKPSAAVVARIADLEFARGHWDKADEQTKRALEIDANDPSARWIAARLRMARGEPAADDLRWFIEYYNAHEKDLEKDADTLVLIGQAAEQYYWSKARGDDLAEGLNDVLNHMYEAAIKADPKCWQAAYLEGQLFVAGFREPPARKELNRALLINPSAAEALVALGRLDLEGYKLASGRHRAEDALEINPECASAHVLKADCDISDERFADAYESAQKAVALNPRSEEALARLAASCRLKVDPLGAAEAEARALAVNPRPVAFYNALGERLADRRKYHSAERAFMLALEADPANVPARIDLGMLHMQTGREREAKELFDTVQAAWPFQDNVRTNNMLAVLAQLATYKAIPTEHFVVSVPTEKDMLLGKYLSRFLEQAYRELTKKFAYEPYGKTQIEVMKDHQWFSGRTTGLPFVPTIGACTGKVVALANPASTKKPFNWSRVMVHEYTHVITLRQTDFNIPHWFTEALAVESEKGPRPQPWNKMLAERVPARKRVLNLDNINLGFIRPEELEDRQMAYCQAQLYAQYMTKRFGDKAIPAMLSAYLRGLSTDQAIPACFHVDKADFEKGYLSFLDDVVKTINARVESEEKLTFSEIERRLKEKPDDPEMNARMAYENFARKDFKTARPFADKALKLEPHQPLASYVKARLFQAIGDDASALQVLEPALDPKAPNERVVDLLAELIMNAGRLDDAAKLYETAHQADPFHSKWIAGLARVHLRQNDMAKVLADMALLAENDADDLKLREELASRYLARKEYDPAAKWATECLYIQVNDPAYHVLLADAEAGRKQFDTAIEEYHVALDLKPKKTNDIRVKLAKTLREAGRIDDAKAALDEVLKADPEHPDAKALREEMNKAK